MSIAYDKHQQFIFYTWFFSFYFLIFNCSKAQNFVLNGQVREFKSNLELPFVTIIVDDSSTFLSDIDGRFSIILQNKPEKIRFASFMYRDFVVQEIKDSLSIELVRTHIFPYDTYSNNAGMNLIKQVVLNKKNQYQKLLKQYSYNTYNKITLTTTDNKKLNNYIHGIKGILPFKLKTLDSIQHIFIIEAVTNKKYLDDLHQRENIYGAKSSNISIPSLFLKSTQYQSYSIYDNFININGQDYLSPLARNYSRHYIFNEINNLEIDGDSIAIVKFHPSKTEKFATIKGLLYINRKSLSIQHIIISPAEYANPEIKSMQSYKSYNNKSVFLERIKTQIISRKNLTELNYLAEANTFIDSLLLNDSALKKNQFDEVILHYNKDAEAQDDNFWAKNRIVPLTKIDSSTYKFYNSWDKMVLWEKFLNMGEHLATGSIPFKKANIETNKIINVNEVEGLRLGVGGQTNSNFSEKNVIGAYVGYGFKDKKPKYGVNYSYRISKYMAMWYHGSYSHDLKEAGAPDFSFDRYQYSSEVLRKFRLRILDFSHTVKNSFTFHPLKYMDVSLSYKIQFTKPTYQYFFKESLIEKLNSEEIEFGFKYAYGEKLIQSPALQKSLGSKFPVIYLQFTRGFKGMVGDFDYNKIDFKVEQKLSFLNFGITNYQFIAGKTFGDLPYSFLYNMRGSRKPFAVVTHNSFETMRYNEFLSSQYFALFIKHNFGRMYFRNPHFQPSISILHNSGIGFLGNREQHLLLDYNPQTMEKGFLETGAFGENIFVLKMTGFKVGLGAGFFLRYGPYALPKAGENLVFKLALNFHL